MDMHQVASRPAVAFQAPAPAHEWLGRPSVAPARRPQGSDRGRSRAGWWVMPLAGQCGRILLGWAAFATLLVAAGLARL
jgi:hypothetical protein